MNARKKILIVDDSATALMMVKMILGRYYDLVTARDGQEAVEVAQKETPDLVVMDVVMPRLDGFGACKAMRETAATKSTPIILCTTKGNMKDVESGYAAGCSDYVTKPVNSLELLTKVKNFLGE